MTRLAHFNVFQAGTGGFIGLPSNIPPLVFAIQAALVLGATVSALVLLLGGAAAVASFRIPRPNRLTLYSILAISLAVASGHLAGLMGWK